MILQIYNSNILFSLYFFNKLAAAQYLRNVEYSILLVMSELSTVRCDRALRLWIAGTRASSVDGELPWRCCGRWTVRWTAVKGSCGVHAWIEGASGDGRRVSWFAPQNQAGRRRLKMPSRGGTGVDLGTGGGTGVDGV